MPFDAELAAVAERFVRFVHSETDLPVIVCDEAGTIAHATVASRVGSRHPGAQRILRGEVDEVLVTDEMEAADPRMKRGCNSPIRVAGHTAGTFGVAGPLDVSRPIAHVAAGVLAGWIRETAQRARLRTAAAELHAVVERLGGRVEQAAREAAAVEARMGTASRSAAADAARTDEVLGAVAGIAAQSRTLALNGSVEATRAGDAGRAFAVVAREMLALAEDARASAAAIQGSIAGARAALERHAAAVETIGGAARGRVEALREATRAVSELAARVGGLAASFEGEEQPGAGGDAEEPLDERFWAMAERFVEFVSAETGHAVIVCDASATIVRATDRRRIGQRHAGAARILAGAQEAAVTAEEAARDGRVKEGCSCPIALGGRCVGTFGITGPLAVTRPLARVAASVLATRVREHRSRALLEREAAAAFAAVDALAVRSAEAIGASARGAADARDAAGALEQRLDETEAVVAAIAQISQQSRIIAVNASVEAASAQERGHAFGNVAGGMRALAEEAHRAGREIAAAIARIRAAAGELAEAGAVQDRAVREQAEASAAVVEAAQGVRGTLAGLIGSFES